VDACKISLQYAGIYTRTFILYKYHPVENPGQIINHYFMLNKQITENSVTTIYTGLFTRDLR
jgi:hypothetical protein